MSIWGKRRQAIYLLAILGAVAVIGVAGFFAFKPSPSCFDGKQNGGETGVDCGGACLRVCLVGVQPLQVSWTRVFPISSGSYYVIAVVENPNAGIGIEHLPYTLRLTDDSGLLVTTREGETFVNPREKLVIFEGGITTGARVPTRASITFGSNFDWRRLSLDKPALSVEKRSFSNEGKPQLVVAVTNNSIYDLAQVKLPVIMSDRSGNAFAGSSTVIDHLAKSETKTVVFTWPSPFAALPASIDVYPRVNLFSLPQ